MRREKRSNTPNLTYYPHIRETFRFILNNQSYQVHHDIIVYEWFRAMTFVPK